MTSPNYGHLLSHDFRLESGSINGRPKELIAIMASILSPL